MSYAVTEEAPEEDTSPSIVISLAPVQYISSGTKALQCCAHMLPN